MIAVPVSSGKLSATLGQCEQVECIETRDGKIIGSEILASPSHEPGMLPMWLHDQGAEVVISGKMGEKALALLKEKGIEVIIGVPLDTPESLVGQYLGNTKVSKGNGNDGDR